MKLPGGKILPILAISWCLLASTHCYATVPKILAVIRCDTVQTLFGYQIVPLGDQNGDGYADFLIWDYRNIGFIYYGGNPVPTQPARRIYGAHGTISNVGDVNGDGIDDVAAWQSKLGLFLGGNGLDTIPHSIFGLDTLISVGPSVSSKNIGCSGTTRVLSTRYDYSSVLQYDVTNPPDSVPTGILRPWWFPHPGYGFGVSMAEGDFNGDGKRDVVMNLRPSEQYGVKSQVCIYWGGCSFDTVPSLLFSQSGPLDYTKLQFGLVIQNIGDFNGDGYDDLFVGHWESQDSTGLIYFGGPTFDSIPDLTIYDTPTRAKAAGDLNGDGYADLITSYPLQSSSFSYVDIFYGGPNLHATPDLRINVSDMPEYLLEFGMDIAGLGDVNGDGIDDFAVSAVDAGGHGVVYIFSGTKSGTDVGLNRDQSLPTRFVLHPIYPNPFNPSTTISLDLPKREAVKLTVFDITGRVVRTLLDKQLAAGSHRVTWDGKNEAGHPAASGVYLFRLSTPDYQQTVKGTLLK